MPVAGSGKDWLEAIGGYDTADEAAVFELTSNHFLKEDVIKLAEVELNFLAAMAIPSVFKYMFPPLLLSVWQLLKEQEKLDRQNPQIALGIPRAHAKTTLVKLFVLYCILFTKRKFILIIGNTENLATNILSDICDMLNEENIINTFGDWKIGKETDRQDLKKFGFRGRNVIIAAIGAGGSLRGLNIKNERPDIMIFEDIQTREDADSADLCSKLETWMTGTAMKAKSPSGCMFLFVGNMYPTPHSLLRKIKNNPTWIKFVSGAILEDGTALWPELRPIEDLLREFENDVAFNKPEIFFSEVLNDDTRGINSRVDFSALPPWKWHPDTDRPQGKFIIIDPSANKQGGDLVAIGQFEVYDSIPGLRQVIEEPLSPGATIKRALILALTTNTKLIAVESVAYQSTLLYWFEQVTKAVGIEGIYFVEVYPGGASKNARISDLMKSLPKGEVLLHQDVKPIVARQIADWNPFRRNNKDNILDLLTYANKVLELHAPLIATQEFLTVEGVIAQGVQENNHAF